MLEYIRCYGGPVEHWGPLPATRQASREILIEQISKSGQGQHSVYSVSKTEIWGLLGEDVRENHVAISSK